MKGPASGKAAASGNGSNGTVKYYKRDFWSEENLKFVEPHFRMEKTARLVNRIAAGKESSLLDVGCGPATLQQLLSGNIHYFGIDIAIHNPAPNLIESDLVESPIRFDDEQFDIVVAQGVFEYLGEFQSQKFSEIAGLLTENGRFVVTYWNFDHRSTQIYWPFSNIQPLSDFRGNLERYFNIDNSFPASHNWNHGMSDRRLLRALNRHVNVNIPLVSKKLAVEYFFICSPRRSGAS